MVIIKEIKKALIPINSLEADNISDKNYDEFYSDEEIIDILKNKKSSILSVTMPHCDILDGKEIVEENSDEALNRAASNLKKLIDSDRTKIVNNCMFVYQIVKPGDNTGGQIGLLGMANAEDIRTEEDRDLKKTIIRNEKVNINKVQGRIKIINTTKSFVGVVTLGLEDIHDKISNELKKYISQKECDFFTVDDNEYHHKLWLVDSDDLLSKFKSLFKEEEFTYITDGNHRSLAASMSNYNQFLCLFFPLKQLKILPYNRLVKADEFNDDIRKKIENDFDILDSNIEDISGSLKDNEMGFYTKKKWYKLIPKQDWYKDMNFIEKLAANVIQNQVIDKVLGIKNITDKRIKYVGGNRSNEFLKERVDSGEFEYAMVIPALTVKQLVDICRAGSYLPPKSTWFAPKVRSGLVIALQDF